MEQLQNYLTEVANTKIQVSSNGTKVEQKASRTIKEQTTKLLLNALSTIENDSVRVVRTLNGIALAIDNEIGFIPLEISVSVKNLDYDVFFENEEYENHQKELIEKAEAKAKAKELKIQADAKKRAEAKALKESRKST